MKGLLWCEYRKYLLLKVLPEITLTAFLHATQRATCPPSWRCSSRGSPSGWTLSRCRGGSASGSSPSSRCRRRLGKVRREHNWEYAIGRDTLFIIKSRVTWLINSLLQFIIFVFSSSHHWYRETSCATNWHSDDFNNTSDTPKLTLIFICCMSQAVFPAPPHMHAWSSFFAKPHSPLILPQRSTRIKKSTASKSVDYLVTPFCLVMHPRLHVECEE